MALTSFVGPEPPQLAYIGVRADLRKGEETAKAIAEMEFVRFVATMMGRYDILVMTLVRDGSELVRLVNEEIIWANILILSYLGASCFHQNTF